MQLNLNPCGCSQTDSSITVFKLKIIFLQLNQRGYVVHDSNAGVEKISAFRQIIKLSQNWIVKVGTVQKVKLCYLYSLTKIDFPRTQKQKGCIKYDVSQNGYSFRGKYLSLFKKYFFILAKKKIWPYFVTWVFFALQKGYS